MSTNPDTADALCPYNHVGFLSVTSNSRVMCRHCKSVWSIEKIMGIHIKLDKLVSRQMNDANIWDNSDDFRVRYLQDEIGKLHCLIEEIEL